MLARLCGNKLLGNLLFEINEKCLCIFVLAEIVLFARSNEIEFGFLSEAMGWRWFQAMFAVTGLIGFQPSLIIQAGKPIQHRCHLQASRPTHPMGTKEGL